MIAFSQNDNSIADIKDDDAEDYTPIIPLICSIFWPMYPQKKNMCNKILFMEHDTITKRITQSSSRILRCKDLNEKFVKLKGHPAKR